MQLPDALNSLGHPTATQPPPTLIDHLDIVMILGPVIPNEDQHNADPLPARTDHAVTTLTPNEPKENPRDLMDQCSPLTRQLGAISGHDIPAALTLSSPTAGGTILIKT